MKALVFAYVILHVMTVLTEGKRPPESCWESDTPPYYECNAYPSIIYPMSKTMAKPGETCNYNHWRNISDAPISFSEFETSCEPPSTCEFMRDKTNKANLIQLSDKQIKVTDYKTSPSAAPKNVKVHIYYKKCVCPTDKTFQYWTRTCVEEKDKNPPAPGLYCSSAFKMEFFFMSLLLSLGILIYNLNY